MADRTLVGCFEALYALRDRIDASKDGLTLDQADMVMELSASIHRLRAAEAEMKELLHITDALCAQPKGR